MAEGGPKLRRSAGGVLDLADPALKELLTAVVERGVSFSFSARGSSMHPFIRDGDVVTVSPLRGRPPLVGDIIAFRGGHARLVVHRVVRLTTAADGCGGFETRGDNRPLGDGRVAAADVLGVVTRVERRGRPRRVGTGPESALLGRLSRIGALQPMVRATRSATRLSPGRTHQAPAGMAPAPLSAEVRALLFCAQTLVGTRDPADFRAALAACTSPELVCHEAVRQGMLGLLHKLIHDQPDTEFAAFVLERLDALCRQSALRALTQTASLLRLLGVMQAGGIVAMPIKGPAWAERLYDDVSLRRWDDLDLLVSHAQIPAARQALLEAGLRDWTQLNPRIMRRRHAEGELTFFSPSDRNLWIDLHWEIGVGPGARGLDAQDVLARAENGELLGSEVLTPNPVDLLLITCLQGTRDGWNTVEALLALATQARALPAGAWPQVMAAARAAGCARRVVVGVAHCCRVLGLKPPPHVAGLLARDATARRLLASLAPDSLIRIPTQGRGGQLAKLRWRTVSSDSLVAAAGHTMVRVVRPSPDDWRLVTLPLGLEWLYWLIRPLRLAFKWALGR